MLRSIAWVWKRNVQSRQSLLEVLQYFIYCSRFFFTFSGLSIKVGTVNSIRIWLHHGACKRFFLQDPWLHIVTYFSHQPTCGTLHQQMPIVDLPSCVTCLLVPFPTLPTLGAQAPRALGLKYHSQQIQICVQWSHLASDICNNYANKHTRQTKFHL